jgi:molecular chaperone GrpE
MADEKTDIPEAPTPANETGRNPEDHAAALQLELARARDEHLRALAELENTRRRAERQAQEARAYAIDRFARDLLPVADTMARALGSVSEEVRAADEAVRNLFEGVELTERALIDAFARHGLRPVGKKGEKFDPNLHQAVAQVASDAPAGSIAEVMQLGYVLNERTLRAAIVAVSTGPAGEASGPKEGASANAEA